MSEADAVAAFIGGTIVLLYAWYWTMALLAHVRAIQDNQVEIIRLLETQARIGNGR